MAEHIGIDLGTTHSLVAATINGVPTILPDPETGDALLPSIVHFDPSGTILIGQPAEAKLVTDSQTTIYSAKRLMGRGAGDSEQASDGLAYAITSDCQIILPNGTKVSAPAVASHILHTLATRAAATLGTTDIKAVIKDIDTRYRNCPEFSVHRLFLDYDQMMSARAYFGKKMGRTT
jgi:molecular chaperone DnaK (HSP70)